MQKIFSMFLVLVFLCSLSSCAPSVDPVYTPPSQNLISSVNEFKYYLDLEGYVYNMGESKFLKIVDKFSLDGKKLTDIEPVNSYSSDTEYGFICNASHLVGDKGFYISAKCETLEDDSTKETYIFRVNCPLEGISLPCGINFEDTIESALKKLGTDLDIDKDFVPDEGFEDYTEEYDTTMTLFKNETSHLILNDFNRTRTPAEYAYPYVISFTEEYEVNDEKFGNKNIKRSIGLYFGDGFFEAETLGLIQITYQEN